MSAPVQPGEVEGYVVPLHRSLTEPILLAGAPRLLAICNGTVAAVLGLGLQVWWLGLLLWLVGHSLAAWAASVDRQWPAVLSRHLPYRALLDV